MIGNLDLILKRQGGENEKGETNILKLYIQTK